MANPIGDRNLLFGILAVQKKIISLDAFVSAMKAWVGAKNKGLAQILREQNALNENQHAVIEELVYDHLAKNANDATKGLAALSLVGPPREELAKIADADVKAGLAKVPAKAPPAPKPTALPPEAVKAAPPKKPEVAKPKVAEVAPPTAPAEPRRSGIAGWVLVAGGMAAGIVVAVLAAAAMFAAVYFTGFLQPGDLADDPIAELKPIPKPIDPPAKDPKDDPNAVKPPVKDPKGDPVVVVPPVKDPKDPKDVPVVVNPPVKVGLDAEFILELPRPAGRAMLTADGQRVVYTLQQKNSVITYREAPAFDAEKTAAIDGAETPVYPLGSSLDGKRMALTAGTANGPTIFVWNWSTMSIEKMVRPRFPGSQGELGPQAASVFSPDGKWLLTYEKRDVKSGPLHWLHLHEVRTGNLPGRWTLDAEPAMFGFTPDSRTVFYAAKNDEVARTWSTLTAKVGTIPFPQLAKSYAFAPDFSKYVYVETPNQVQMGHFDGLRQLGKVDTKKENVHVKVAAYSQDNRFLLMGTEDVAKRPALTGKAMILDLTTGKTVSLTDKLDGVPERAELAANGVGLLQGQSLKPRLYRFPVVAEAFVKVPVGPTPGFTALFNGKDLTGWRQPKILAGNWRVEDGILIGSAPGKLPGRLYTERPLARDFHLRVEARVSDKGTGSLVFRCPLDTLVGYEAPINSTQPFIAKTGSLYAQVPGRRIDVAQVKETPIKPDQWFTMEIIAEGNRLIIKIDGLTTADLVDNNHVPAAEHLALLHSAFSTIEFRKIEVKEQNFVAAPPVVPAEGFVPLFNGKDLTGWKKHAQQPGEWRVLNGILSGFSAVNGHLLTERGDYRDFHLRVEARAKEGKAGGVRFRYSEDLQGYETTLNTRSGGMIHIRKDREPIRNLGRLIPVPANEWTTLEIIAQGNRLQLKVNGQVTVDGVDEKNAFAGGHICLYDFRESIEFRRIEIKEFNLVAAPPIVPADGFISLFNGKDLTGWKKNAQFSGVWRVENGILTGVAGERNYGRLETEKMQPKDFHLRVEARVMDAATGHVTLRSPEGTRAGYDVGMSGFIPGDVRIGGLVVQGGMGTIRTYPGSPRDPIKRGQWFLMEAIVEANRVVVKVDGRTTCDVVDMNHMNAGHIALGQHNQSPVEFRRIEIKEIKGAVALPPVMPPAVAPFAPDPQFVQLFNGKDLTGWKTNRIPPGDWKVVDGVLTGASPNVRELFTTRNDYGDFHLRMEGRINADGNNWVVFRYPHGEPTMANLRIGGYAARVSSSQKDFSKTGSLNVYELTGMRTLPVQEVLAPPGEWFNFEIIAVGDAIDIKVNGKVTKSFLNPKTHLKGGSIVLGFGDTNRQTVIEYRKIEIKEFKAVAAPPLPPPARPLEAPVALFNGKDIDNWRIEGLLGWKVSPDGELIGTGPDTAIISKRTDYRNLIAKVELSASADVDAYFAFRQIPDPLIKIKGVTSRLLGDGAFVRAGYSGWDGRDLESGNQKIQVKPGEVFLMEFQANHDGMKIFCNGKITSSVGFGPERHPPGALGLHIAKGSVRIKKFEVSAEPPIAGPPVAAPPFAPVGDFVQLFNAKDLTGWQAPKPAGNWRVDNGILTGSGEESSVLYSTRADFKNFHLRLEGRFTMPPDAGTSGVLFRALSPKGEPGNDAGYEAVIAKGKLTGDLYLSGKTFGKPVPATTPANVPAGEWFTLEVFAEGSRVRIKVNGKDTTDFVDQEKLFTSGHIALRQGAECKLEFRKIEVRELKAEVIAAPPVPDPPPKAAAGFTPLFNAKDLAGWQPHAKRPGNWRVENGILIGSAPVGGSLYSTRPDYKDFHLRAELRINDRGFGRIFTRATYDPTKIPFKVLGYETLINLRPVGDKIGTLSATSLVSSAGAQARESAIAPNEWVTVEVIAKGESVTVKVNGAVVAQYRDERNQFARSGHIALHQDANAVIEFRKVEIDDLSAPRPKDDLPPIDLPKGGAFVPLFNGIDVNGWKVFDNQQNGWRVVDGILIGSGNASSRLHSPRGDYKNFHLRVEARVGDQSAGGVFVRAPFSPFKGYEAKLNATHQHPNKTGSLEAHFPGKPVNLVSVDAPPVPFGAWFTMEVIAQGKRLTVIIDGKTTADYANVDDEYMAGHIALAHFARSTIEFRKIEVKELPAP